MSFCLSESLVNLVCFCVCLGNIINILVSTRYEINILVSIPVLETWLIACTQSIYTHNNTLIVILMSRDHALELTALTALTALTPTTITVHRKVEAVLTTRATNKSHVQQASTQTYACVTHLMEVAQCSRLKVYGQPVLVGKLAVRAELSNGGALL